LTSQALVSPRIAALLLVAAVPAHTAMTLVRLHETGPRFAMWLGLLAIYGGALWASMAPALSRWRLAALAAQAVTPFAMAQLVPCAYTPLLDVIVAWQVGWLLRPRLAVAWVVVQAGLMLAVVLRACSPEMRDLATLFVAVQGLALLAALGLRQEARRRQALARVNSALCEGRDGLRDRGRRDERRRIARELHDVIGHHLAALGMRLEAAARGGDGEHVVAARGIAHALGREVRSVVGGLREEDLAAALARLPGDAVGLRVHVDAPPDLVVACPERAHALVRCAQEIVTNTVKHGAAANLWIEVRATGDGVALRARDDGLLGPGADAAAGEVVPGHGLRGMQERVGALGGRLRAGRARDGFVVEAWLPEAA
jgi:signal transduction histidine kinase